MNPGRLARPEAPQASSAGHARQNGRFSREGLSQQEPGVGNNVGQTRPMAMRVAASRQLIAVGTNEPGSLHVRQYFQPVALIGLREHCHAMSARAHGQIALPVPAGAGPTRPSKAIRPSSTTRNFDGGVLQDCSSRRPVKNGHRQLSDTESGVCRVPDIDFPNLTEVVP